MPLVTFTSQEALKLNSGNVKTYSFSFIYLIDVLSDFPSSKECNIIFSIYSYTLIK